MNMKVVAKAVAGVGAAIVAFSQYVPIPHVTAIAAGLSLLLHMFDLNTKE